MLVFAALTLTSAQAASSNSVKLWGIYEVQLEGPTNGNPFLDTRLTAVFSNGSRRIEIAGFYDGEGVYKVRFMPEEQGNWHYETRSNRRPLTGRRGAFTVTAPAAGVHGPVRVRNDYHFAYADGAPYRPFGTTSYNWFYGPEAWQEQTLTTLSNSPFNKLRMLVFPENNRYKTNDPGPMLLPFEGTSPDNLDLSRFNPLFFQKLEARLTQLGNLGIQADLILFHPYGRKWGFDSMDTATDERYLRYLVARLAAFHNVWWSMCNEYDQLRTKREEDWDHYFQLLQASDPYNHLRSIHHMNVLYDNRKPWITHASLQNGMAAEDPSRAVLYRDVWRKPVVFDEVKYEGNIAARWGQLTGQELVQRFWAGAVSGTYVQHGECVQHPDGAFVSYGGVLRGESPARIAFLRKILEAGPAEGLNPIDYYQCNGMAGKPGQYYLIYFGTQTPTNWPFSLYRAGLQEGAQFQVDVIDTWNMTITPVEGLFTTAQKDRYSFVDKDGRGVPLPGKPYMALRLRRVGKTETEGSSTVPTEQY